MAKSFEVIYLQPDQTQFSRTGDTLSLAVNIDGEEVHYPRVVLRSCFPVSDTNKYLSVRDANDEKLTEIGVIEDWTLLSHDDREAISAELNLFYLVPRITKIHDIKDDLGFLYWKVDTDKGPQEFAMRNSVIRYSRQVGPGHFLLIDVNQARHEIMDIESLDSRSQRLLQLHFSL